MFRTSWRGFALSLVAGLSAFPTGLAAEDARVGLDIVDKNNTGGVRAIVVDARGRSLGRLIGENQVLIVYPDGDAILALDPDGYGETSRRYPAFGYPPKLLFVTSDCSGQGYAMAGDAAPALALFSKGPDAPDPGFTRSGQVFYAARATMTKNIASTNTLSAAGRATCSKADLRNVVVSPVKARPIASFKLPLSITFRQN